MNEDEAQQELVRLTGTYKGLHDSGVLKSRIPLEWVQDEDGIWYINFPPPSPEFVKRFREYYMTPYKRNVPEFVSTLNIKQDNEEKANGSD